MAVQGVFTSDANIEGTRTGDFAGGILMIQPEGSAPLFALSSGMSSVDAKDTAVHWFEENKLSGQFKATANAAIDATSIVFEDVSFLLPNTMILSEDGEVAYVTAVNQGTKTASVIRGWGGSTGAAITANDLWYKLGTAHKEASAKPVAVANVGVSLYNYTQIFRNAWEVSGTSQAVNNYTGNTKAKNKLDASFFHAEEIEKSMIWGRRNIAIEDGHPVHTMNGLNNMISTNVEAAGNTTSWDQLDDFFKDIFSYNIKNKPNERIAFTGNNGIQIINQIIRGDDSTRFNVQTRDTEFGMKINKFVTPYGDVMIKTHPLMTESPLWTSDLYVYHPGAIEMKYLRRTFIDNYDKDGTRAGADSDYGVYTTECTVCYKAERTGGRLTGLKAGA